MLDEAQKVVIGSIVVQPQMTFEPVIVHGGGVKFDNGVLQVLVHPFRSVITTVYVPGVLTVMHCVFVANPAGPIQEYFVMPGVAQNRVVAPTHTLVTPTMLQIGCGLIVSVLLQVLMQPLESVIVTKYVPAVLMVMHEDVARNPFGPVHE